mgnify:CR=1 FL=1
MELLSVSKIPFNDQCAKKSTSRTLRCKTNKTNGKMNVCGFDIDLALYVILLSSSIGWFVYDDSHVSMSRVENGYDFNIYTLNRIDESDFFVFHMYEYCISDHFSDTFLKFPTNHVLRGMSICSIGSMQTISSQFQKNLWP